MDDYSRQELKPSIEEKRINFFIYDTWRCILSAAPSDTFAVICFDSKHHEKKTEPISGLCEIGLDIKKMQKPEKV